MLMKKASASESDKFISYDFDKHYWIICVSQLYSKVYSLEKKLFVKDLNLNFAQIKLELDTFCKFP